MSTPQPNLHNNSNNLQNLTPGTTVMLDSALIYQHPDNNPRKSYSDEKWERLKHDLRKYGQLMPVIARVRCHHDGPKTEKHLLVMEDGHSRSRARSEMGVDRDETGVRACDLLVTIKPSIEDRVLKRLASQSEGKSPEELAKLKKKLVNEEKAKLTRESHVVNTAREEWNAWAEAVSLEQQLGIQRDLYPEATERELQDRVAEINNMKGDLVRMRLSLLDSNKTPADIQDLLKVGELGYSEAIELRRITDSSVRADLSEKSYTEGWSANQLKKRIDKAAAAAEARGEKIKASRKRPSPKKNSSMRTEEETLTVLSQLREQLDDLSEDEVDLIQQTLGAISAFEYMLTPKAELPFEDQMEARVEQFFEGEDEESILEPFTEEVE